MQSRRIGTKLSVRPPYLLPSLVLINALPWHSVATFHGIRTVETPIIYIDHFELLSGIFSLIFDGVAIILFCSYRYQCAFNLS